ncbi:MAG: SlyX family protein [Pseudomonadota bacterium]
MDQRIEQLEIKIAFLEEASSQLSELVYQQRQEIDALRTQLVSVAGRLEAAQSQPTAYKPEDEKPPHY